MNVKTILVPFDFSSCSESALHFGTTLARDNRASLLILHAMQPFEIYDIDAKYGAIPLYPDADTLTRLLKTIKPSDSRVPFDHHLVIGDAAMKIAEFAKQESVDLIVMGTHGRTGLARLLTGSVAESVLRRAPCPVFTVKLPPREPVREEKAIPKPAVEGIG